MDIPSDLVAQIIGYAGDNNASLVSKSVSEKFSQQEELRVRNAEAEYRADPYGFVVAALKKDDNALLARYCCDAKFSYWHHTSLSSTSGEVFERLIYEYVRSPTTLKTLAAKGYYPAQVIVAAQAGEMKPPGDSKKHRDNSYEISKWITNYCLVETFKPELLAPWFKELAVSTAAYREAAIVALWWHGAEVAKQFFEMGNFSYDDDVLIAMKHANCIDLLTPIIDIADKLHHDIPIDMSKIRKRDRRDISPHLLSLPYPVKYVNRHSKHRWPYPSAEAVSELFGKNEHRKIIQGKLSQFYANVPKIPANIVIAIQNHNVEFLQTCPDVAMSVMGSEQFQWDNLLRCSLLDKGMFAELSVDSAVAILKMSGQPAEVLRLANLESFVYASDSSCSDSEPSNSGKFDYSTDFSNDNSCPVKGFTMSDSDNEHDVIDGEEICGAECDVMPRQPVNDDICFEDGDKRMPSLGDYIRTRVLARFQ